MESTIFRKSSLERISSPEQLNDYVKVTSGGVWLLLLGLFALLFSGGVWAVTGAIPDVAQLTGVAFGPDGQEIALYAYVPMGVARKLSPGMDVQVSPDYAPRAEYGFIAGRIESIGEVPVTEQEIISAFGTLQYVQTILPPGNPVQMKITLNREGGKLQWSNQRGESMGEVANGSFCSVLVIIRERKPYELLLGR